MYSILEVGIQCRKYCIPDMGAARWGAYRWEGGGEGALKARPLAKCVSCDPKAKARLQNYRSL